MLPKQLTLLRTIGGSAALRALSPWLTGQRFPIEATPPLREPSPDRRPAGPSPVHWSHWLFIATALAATVLTIAQGTAHNLLPSSANSLAADVLDRNLQRAATAALGDRRGAVIVMDPQTGRVRAVVNPKLAFEESLPPGSTIKPFTALAASRSGLIDDNSRTVCREDYSHDDFHTVCSHPRGIPPLNTTDAIAYSCNYYFGKLGERMDEAVFVSTLSEFGFGRKTGINAVEESQGRLLRGGWRSQNAIGESNNLLATPIQMLNAYSALVNGGHLFAPRIAAPSSFVATLQADIKVDDAERSMIVKGMRGAVRYGTAETAGLYRLPSYIFGKTGTATQINGFRSQGWFIGFASESAASGPDDSPSAPERTKLAVLVFLAKAHGSEAAELALPIFDEFARASSADPPISQLPRRPVSQSYRRSLSAAPPVRIHLVRENLTQTLPLEDYVRAVVATEGSTESEVEALKALAIASRTYAVKNLGRHENEGYDFCSSTHCQRYRTISSGADISAAALKAVEATRGDILRDASGAIVDSYFSASCGGATSNIGSLWGSVTPPYLKGVRDEYCVIEPGHDWTDVIAYAHMLKALQSDPRTDVGGRLHSVTVVRRDQSNRAEFMALEGDRRRTISGWEFKIVVGRALGWNILKSTRFEVTRSGANFVFRGNGFGHGLGLCQEGAHVMASRGSNYKEILAKYFPTTRIANEVSQTGSADLIWKLGASEVHSSPGFHSHAAIKRSRQSLASENFRISYPAAVNQRDVQELLGFLQSSRKSLLDRLASAGLNPRLPPLEIFINETTGDFVGRTGQPYWAAAATKDNRIELQPLETLRRRRILETTLRHELVHTLVDALGGGRAPRWLAEGLAIHFAGEGALVSRHQPAPKLTMQEIEQKLASARSAEEMRMAYSASYSEVRRLISREGEAKVWRRVTN